MNPPITRRRIANTAVPPMRVVQTNKAFNHESPENCKHKIAANIELRA
jgi:hypothetical protein